LLSDERPNLRTDVCQFFEGDSALPHGFSRAPVKALDLVGRDDILRRSGDQNLKSSATRCPRLRAHTDASPHLLAERRAEISSLMLILRGDPFQERMQIVGLLSFCRTGSMMIRPCSTVTMKSCRIDLPPV
jgi:hypothetical protein